MRKPYLVRDATTSKAIRDRRKTSVCIHCGDDAMKEALFKSGGFTIVEKYCDDCLKTEKFSSIMTF